MKKSILAFIREQCQPVPPVMTANLEGKTVLVTGANTGIGFEAAKHFARMKPGKLIIACRNTAKGSAAVAKIKEETGFDRIEIRTVDLSNFSSVTEFCNTLQKEEERLDLLVANAGMVTTQYRTTDDGWETTLQVNVLSTLLYCVLLAPLMAKTSGITDGSEPRIVIVGSGVHYLASFNRDVLETDNPLKMLNKPEYCTSSVMEQRYPHSKIIVLFMVRALAKILKNSAITVNCVDPGFCISDIRNEAKGMQRLLFMAMERYLAWTAEEGSRQLIWASLANDKDIEVMRGGFICCMSVAEPSDYVISEDGQRAEVKFWTNLVEELTNVDPRVAGILKELGRSDEA
ncbi:short-chain dehydrogenase [Coprinopsis marcescibilis]|uniref:Short-chain dehydrogenase n=1 Tax=Coprinopsis marcescibilis TaxID=230819 RepID=A0A5C3KSJ8_COPMA|nr:short-chain dehydrogenase [Coprinopsis marcescibilis]